MFSVESILQENFMQTTFLRWRLFFVYNPFRNLQVHNALVGIGAYLSTFILH